MEQLLEQILKFLKETKIELAPVYAVISPVVIWIMSLVKNPERLTWFTVLSSRLRAWMVAIFAFVGTFAVAILVMQERAWTEMVALSVVMCLVTVGLYEWLRAVTSKPPAPDEAPPRSADPRRP